MFDASDSPSAIPGPVPGSPFPRVGAFPAPFPSAPVCPGCGCGCGCARPAPTFVTTTTNSLAPSRPTLAPLNRCAVVALVCALVPSGMFILPAIVFGHIALHQTAGGPEKGRGMAVAALILGYLELAAVLVVLAFLLFVPAANGLTR